MSLLELVAYLDTLAKEHTVASLERICELRAVYETDGMDLLLKKLRPLCF